MESSRTIAATVVGAVIGGIAGYFFLTEHGRQLRRQFEPALEDYARELDSFRASIQRAAGVASEGWKLLNETMEPEQRNVRYPAAQQSSPF